ncbi:MAG: hypothetical protein EpisKO_09880 [Epibacterium sp.]
MGKKGGGQHRPFGQVEARGEVMSGVAGKADAFGWHGRRFRGLGFLGWRGWIDLFKLRRWGSNGKSAMAPVTVR